MCQRNEIYMGGLDEMFLCGRGFDAPMKMVQRQIRIMTKRVFDGRDRSTVNPNKNLIIGANSG
jgi:hypothetical protein